MTDKSPTLHMICGKIAAGKSTLAAELGREPNTIVLSEDDWLSQLYPDKLKTGQDYLHYSALLKPVLGPHIAELLQAGVSVVLDFPANTVAFRGWMRGIIDAAASDHVLHVLDVPDDVCLARLRARNAAGTHAYAATDEMFRQFTQNYVPPQLDEGFNVRVVRSDD